jgi:hypothetical protein
MDRPLVMRRASSASRRILKRVMGNNCQDAKDAKKTNSNCFAWRSWRLGDLGVCI